MSATNGTAAAFAGARQVITIHAEAAPDIVERVAGELRRQRCIVERLAYERLPWQVEDAPFAAGPADAMGTDTRSPGGAARIVALVIARDVDQVAARLRRLPRILGVASTPAE
ncbi:MAG TPA: hypothetical protein VNZ57_05575 [Longimicrobiales bacterium]|nr:hypothetical protein [Longimicrobiales bacterium]